MTHTLPPVHYGVKVMSIGFFLDLNTPVVWRGPMVGKAVQELIRGAEWGELDYLVVDLPPGTGDAQLTLCQSVPVTGAVIVTTPQDVALSDVLKAIGMFEKVKIPILGIVENMSYFICPHCQHRTEIFKYGGVDRRPAPDDPVPWGNRHRSGHPGRQRCGRTHRRESP